MYGIAPSEQIRYPQDLKRMIMHLNDIRNYVAHSKKSGSDFAVECKKHLITLEWILEAFLRRKLNVGEAPFENISRLMGGE